ncbi:MAG: hypothetical protein P1S60_09880 [Anaerolineae bacterium]|nr:hypothetical protein [Anaerolineae bacterium]
MDNTILNQARPILKKTLPDFLQRQNVQACGLGYKVSQGQRTGTLSLVVSVTRKVPPAELSPNDLIPREVAGLVTDVVATGEFHAFALLDPRARHRPAQPGISVGHFRITAGTIGLVVYREGAPYILSNNHVLANSNDAQIGDPIYQPGSADGGTANDQIGTLADFEPIDFGETTADCAVANNLTALLNALARLAGSRHRLQAVRQTAGVNIMDAALAQPDDPAQVNPEIMGIGMVAGVADPYLGQRIQKMGRTTGITQGMINQVDVTVKVNYGGRTVSFSDQVFAGNMSSPGDSGSSILDMGRQVVGLLFAGSETTTILSPIQPVLERFDVTVMS